MHALNLDASSLGCDFYGKIWPLFISSTIESAAAAALQLHQPGEAQIYPSQSAKLFQTQKF